MKTIPLACTTLAVPFAVAAQSVDMDVPFVTTPPAVTEAMLAISSNPVVILLMINLCLLLLGCVPILVIAGTIEGFLSPSALPAGVKIATGVFSGVVMYSYLVLVGRQQAEAGSPETAV